jgi:hypothetical protein
MFQRRLKTYLKEELARLERVYNYLVTLIEDIVKLDNCLYEFRKEKRRDEYKRDYQLRTKQVNAVEQKVAEVNTTYKKFLSRKNQLFDKEKTRRHEEELCYEYRKSRHLVRDYKSKLPSKQVNTTITKIIATTIKVALSEEELEARRIYRQLGLSESDVRDLDSTTARGREEDKVLLSFSSSSLSDSSESSRLLAKEARPEEGEY